MTVSSQTSRVDYAGDGVTAIFPVPFYFLEQSHLQVILSDDVTGAETVLVLNTDYTVTGAGVLSGGSITVPSEPAVGSTLTILRSVPITQETDYVPNDPFPAESHERALDKLTMIIQQLSTDSAGAIKVAVSDPEPSRLPPAASRALKLAGFDSLGNPIAVVATADSAAALALDLLNDTDPAKGAGLVGLGTSLSYMAGTVGYAIQHGAQARTIESFGPTDTPANTLATMQAAIDYCAANGFKLIAGASEYTVDLSTTSITIPDNFRCDLGNALIKRQTGNTTPQDMWINADTVAGNTGLDIRNVRFDGQRTADSLTNVTSAHRFCGLRLVKCTGYLENIRADNTVNGEIQVEGTRGGIMLDQSVDIRAFRLYADGTDGSGVFPYQGKNYIAGVWTANNTGSGFTSFGCDDNDFHYIYSDGSGFSGVSVNGERMRCSFLSSKNSPLNYAGVNIGHDAAGNRATGSIIDNVMVESALGWGITCIGSPDVSGANWVASGSTVNNLRVVNSPGLDVTYKGLTCGGTDIFVSGGGAPHMIKAYITDAALNGLATGGSSTRVIMDNQSYITGCGTAGGTTGAVNAANTTTIEVRGKIENNLQYGVISNGATALADIVGATVRGSGVANFLSASSGILRHQKVRTSTDAMSGTVTATAASTATTVNNGNAQAVARILVWPGNALAVTRLPFVNAVTPGVSFTFTLPSAAAGTEVYYWEII